MNNQSIDSFVNSVLTKNNMGSKNTNQINPLNKSELSSMMNEFNIPQLPKKTMNLKRLV